MTGLRVITPGARSLVVDRGFRRARGIGVPPGGAMDPRALRLLNGLLGNDADAAAIEVALLSPVLRAEGGAVRVALSGGLSGRISGGPAPRVLPEWTATTLAAGEELRLDPPRAGVLGLIGVGGGVLVPQALGSRSTSLRAGFGGMEGRVLQAGDLLPCVEAVTSGDLTLTPPPQTSGPLRVVPGPQAEWFSADAIAGFLKESWLVTPQTDRMGMRLQGAPLAFAPGKRADITSDGIAPGAIQVPGNGQPIVLLADAQTTGGYAKIATVIRADLWRLAAFVPGDRLAFCTVTVAEAEALMQDEAKVIDQALASIRPVDGLQALWTANLAGAAVDALAPDHFPGKV